MTSGKIRFPILSTIVWLTVAAVLSAGLLRLLIPSVFPATTNRPSGEFQIILWRSALIVWLAAILGAIPLFLWAKRGVMATVTGYFIGSGIRLVICLGAALYCCLILNQPVLPTGLSMVGVYLPILLLETLLVSRYLISLDRSSQSQGDKSPDPANNQSLKETKA